MRVWFNHWFSSIYRNIELMKQSVLDLYVIGSCNNKDAVYQKVCDEWYEEPKLEDGRQYVDWCLNFCKEHSVEVFIPRRNFLAISCYKHEFEQIGVKVMVDENYILLKILNNKMETSSFFRNFLPNNCFVPDMYIANNLKEFKKYYDIIKSQGEKVCIKFAEDVGGASFRIIEEDEVGISVLNSKSGRRINYSQIESILGSADSFKSLIVMPLLTGSEISIDCLNTSNGFVAVPRYKEKGRVERIDFNEDILKRAKEVSDVLNIRHPFNLQYMYHRNKLYLLEVNTSMSGVNLPALALRDLLELPVEIPSDLKSMRVTHVETGVILETL